MVGIGNSDKSTVASMLASRFSEAKYSKTREELTKALDNNNLDSGEIDKLKGTFVKEFKEKNAGKTDEQAEKAFYSNLSNVVGVSADKLKGSSSEPIKIQFNVRDVDSDGQVLTDTKSEDGKIDTGARVMNLSDDNEVELKTSKKGYDYNSLEAKKFKSSLSGLGKTEKGNSTIKSDKEFYDGGSLDKLVQEAKIPDSESIVTGKISPKGSKDIQKLQAYIGIPKERQDGLFGAETMNHLKKDYAEAIRTGNTEKINTLSALMGSLDARINDGKESDQTLSKIVKSGEAFLKGNTKADAKQYALNIAKDLIPKADASLKENPPNIKKFNEIKKSIQDDPKIPENAKIKILEKLTELENKAKVPQTTVEQKPEVKINPTAPKIIPSTVTAKIEIAKDDKGLQPNLSDRTNVTFKPGNHVKSDKDMTFNNSASDNKYFLEKASSITIDEGVKITQKPTRVKMKNPETGKTIEAMSVKLSTGEEFFVPVGQKFSINVQQIVGGTTFNIGENGDIDEMRARFSCAFSSRNVIV